MSRNISRIQLSSVQLADPPGDMHAGHPIRNEDKHTKLLDFVMPRLHHAAIARDDRVERFKDVDKQIFGWIRLSKEDEKRKAELEETGHPFAVKQHMPLTMLHLEDRISYFSGVFAPTNGMFQHVGNANEQKAGQKLLKLMNNHAQHAGYYKHLMRSILDLHKYQMGGLITEWDEDYGFKVQRDGGQTQVTPTIAWEGNRVEHVDLYNAFWASGVHVTELDIKSEFFGQVELTNYHEIQRKGSSGEWLNVKEALKVFDQKESHQQQQSSYGYRTTYYRFPPAELQLANDALSKRQGPWSFLAPYGDSDLVVSKTDGLYELMKLWIWLNPYEHNLVKRNKDNRETRNRLELWKLEIIDGRWIVSAKHVTNAHARIPVSMGTLSIDSLDEWQRSTSEVLRPLQDFMSFLLNTYIDGVRGDVWGLQIFNPEIVDLNKIPKGETAARVPAKPTGQDMDLSKSVHNVQRNRSNDDAIQGFQTVLGIVNQLIPNQALPSQIAGIDRAVDRQVAAVVQGGNRPLQMKARLIDETMLRSWRSIMYFNIIQYQNDVEVSTPEGDRVESVDVNELQAVGLEYVLGQGLKSIDKQMVAQEFQRIIQAVLQSQEATQQVEVLGLIEAWSNYLDIEVDMTQFRKQQQQQQQQQPGAGTSSPTGTETPTNVE